MAIPSPARLRVCFSYAAYAKNLIRHLRSANIPVEPGLSESEFYAVESSLGFTFPPDLRAILREGLPVGPGFLNWRSSSKQQLEILTNLPILGIRKEVSRSGFWVQSWGDRPDDDDRAVKRAEWFLKISPSLVPMYRNFYIPSAPCTAGNPVFFVQGGDVRVWSFDIAGFFQDFEFEKTGPPVIFAAPVWAATEARRIEFWTEIAGRGTTRGWWGGELSLCMEGVFRRLRSGGWREEEVREMMMMDGCDEFKNRERMMICEEEPCVKVMSAKLLCAGWSREDVVESLGCPEDCHSRGVFDGDSFFDVDYSTFSVSGQQHLIY